MSGPTLAIERGEPLAAALQRVSLEQFDVAIGRLSDPDYPPELAVHQARKAMKRLRAVLRLVRTTIGIDDYRHENGLLRDTARVLSEARTAAVMGLALDELVQTTDGADPAWFAPLRAELARRHDVTESRVIGDPRVVATAVADLEDSRKRFARWASDSGPLTANGFTDAFGSVEPGIRRVYARGRRRMAAAVERPSAEAFHDWRKQVKYQRYHMEAVAPMWPQVVGGLETTLDELSEILGTEHDLAELGVFVATERDHCTPEVRRYLLALVVQRRVELQRHAANIGRFVYAETPAAFTKRLAAYWDGWRHPR